MNCLGKLGMCFLVLLNLLFMAGGGCMVAGGVMLKSNTGILGGTYLAMLDNKIIPLLSKVGISPGFDITEVLEMVAIALIAAGGVIAAVAFLGFCGACYKLRPFLLLYAVIITLVSGGEIFTVYFLIELKIKVNNSVKGTLLNLLSVYEGNLGGFDTMAWNAFFVLFKCCGVNRQSDVDDFAVTVWNSTRGTDIVPGYCCQKVTFFTGFLLSNVSCTTTPTSMNSYYESGCYTAIEEAIELYTKTFLSICIVVLVVEAVAIVFSCLMMHQISSDKDKEKKRKANKRRRRKRQIATSAFSLGV